MARLKKFRTINNLPFSKKYTASSGFRKNRKNNDSIKILLEEYEAFILVDYDNLTHEQASLKMNVSRPTFTRIYNQVRQKIAEAFVLGKDIIFEGGNIEFFQNHFKCNSCNTTFTNNDFDCKKMNLSEITCTNCNSNNITFINDCFIKGCKFCKRCK
jgi:predicted DNA-binding protein (UPF0251 family)